MAVLFVLSARGDTTRRVMSRQGLTNQKSGNLVENVDCLLGSLLFLRSVCHSVLLALLVITVWFVDVELRQKCYYDGENGGHGERMRVKLEKG